MIKKYLNYLYYLIIPLLIVGISFGYTTFIYALFALLPLLFMSNRHTVAIFLVMYGGPLMGVIRYAFPYLPVYGLLMEFLGVFLMWDLVSKLLYNHSKAVIMMILTLLLFGLFYLIGPQDSFANKKYTSMCIHGIFMLFGYYALDRCKSIDIENLTRILIIASVCLIAFLISVTKMEIGGFFDYNWFRDQTIMWDYLNQDESSLIVGYQHVGMLALFAIVIYLSQTELRKYHSLFYLFCSFQLVLISGARQAIFGVGLVVALRYSIFRLKYVGRKHKLNKAFNMLFGLIIALYAIILVFQTLSSDAVSRTLRTGDEGRFVLFTDAISIWLDNFVLGSGLGGFHDITGEAYPHNFVLELLCETGIIGTFILSYLPINQLIRNRQGLLHITVSNQFFFLILMAILFRVMVSADLRESIELFSAMYATVAIFEINKNSYNTTIRINR